MELPDERKASCFRWWSATYGHVKLCAALQKGQVTATWLNRPSLHLNQAFECGSAYYKAKIAAACLMLEVALPPCPEPDAP